MQQVIQKPWGQKQRGFTLFEMIIVVALVTLLTTATLVYNKGIGDQIVIAREHAKVIGILIKARSSGFTNPKAGSAEVICGYGVHVDSIDRTFTLFKDLKTDPSSTCNASANRVYDAGEQLDQIVLISGVTVASDMSDVVFIPPYGKVVIDNSDVRTKAVITIASEEADTSKQVRVNIYGQITE